MVKWVWASYFNVELGPLNIIPHKNHIFWVGGFRILLSYQNFMNLWRKLLHFSYFHNIDKYVNTFNKLNCCGITKILYL